MKRIIVLAIGILVLAGNIAAQDIIVTRKAEKIEAKILEVSNSEIKYKKLSNLEGPTFVTPTSDLQTVIYSNGDVQLFTIPTSEELAENQDSIEVAQDTIYSLAEWKGGPLPKFTCRKVHVPGKKYKKERYVGGNMVLKFKDFIELVKRYCPEAASLYAKWKTFVICGYIMIIPCWPAGLALNIVAYHYGSQILDTYNASCAKLPITSSLVDDDNEEEYAQNAPPAE